MLPPEFEPIIAQLTALYRKLLVQDNEAVAVPELLSAEEQIVAFVHALGLALLRVFVDVRLLQAKAGRRPCGCGMVPTVHRITEWKRETPGLWSSGIHTCTARLATTRSDPCTRWSGPTGRRGRCSSKRQPSFW
jgi:hypothetical protein